MSGTNEDCLRQSVFNHRIVTSRDPTDALIGREEGGGGGWGGCGEDGEYRPFPEVCCLASPNASIGDRGMPSLTPSALIKPFPVPSNEHASGVINSHDVSYLIFMQRHS